MIARPEITPPSAEAVARAGALLQAGELVAFPTETVYGLGADATNDDAVRRLFAAKQRPQFNPLIVHVAEVEDADMVAELDDRARSVAQTFWAGPLTLVLPRRSAGPVSPLAAAGLNTLAVRVPGHPVARALLRAAGRPVVAPSANPSGGVSPTTPLHVAEGLGAAVAMILAGGRCPIGIESTVLDLANEPPRLLRPGSVILADLEALIGPVADVGVITEPRGVPRAPGQLASHYAPRHAVRLHATHADSDEALLAFGRDRLVRGGMTRLNLSPDGDLHEAATNLYAMLHSLDKSNCRRIAVMPIPNRGVGIAMNDRLRRAAAPRDQLHQTDTP